MSNLFAGPKRGLKPDEAFARWGNSNRYRDLLSVAELPDCPPSKLSDDHITDPARAKQYRALRGEMNSEFYRLLADGEIFASGIIRGADRREVIHQSLWAELQVAYELNLIVGLRRSYEYPEFFDLDSIPQNIRPIPYWLDELVSESGRNDFRHERDYRNVYLRGMHFALSVLQAKVVELLHKAFLEDEAWQVGKQVLEQAGSMQTKMVDVFKSRADWQALIDSDGTGRYRLRIGSPYSDKVT